MTREQLIEELRKRGVDLGKWKEAEPRTADPQFSGNIRALLGQLKSLVKEQMNQDIAQVELLREAVNRSKYGGGR